MLKPTEEQKSKIIKDHIQPEIDIFLESYKKLEFKETRETLECFLLHSRTLYDFLKTSERQHRDAIATDFIPKSIALNDFPIDKERLDQQLAHISYDRLLPKQINLFDQKDLIYKSIKNGINEFNKEASRENKLII